MSQYIRFLLMIATSTVAMFCLKYLNSYAADHVYFSETRFYMAFMMGAAMAVIMLTFMLGMHKNKKANITIYAGSAVVFMIALLLVRSQIMVGDTSYMWAIFPHHSIAILTSERAAIEDKRVRELADTIIKTQRKEIKEMKWLLNDIEKNGLAKTKEEAEKRPLPELKGQQ